VHADSNNLQQENHKQTQVQIMQPPIKASLLSTDWDLFSVRPRHAAASTGVHVIVLSPPCPEISKPSHSHCYLGLVDGLDHIVWHRLNLLLDTQLVCTTWRASSAGTAHQNQNVRGHNAGKLKFRSDDWKQLTQSFQTTSPARTLACVSEIFQKKWRGKCDRSA